MKKKMKWPLVYLILLVIVIVLGLLSRRLLLPSSLGDGLWAVAVYLGYGVVKPDLRHSHLALLALVTSFLVEFSQLLTWDWLVHVRMTTIGHLLLGQGFLWTDLVAYSLGILVAYSLFAWFDRFRQ